MKNKLIALLFLPLVALGQENTWQQEVDYKIKVRLDDRAHTLTGTIQMGYKNNSPQALSEIKMHLWANAHKMRNTALVRQMNRMGKNGLYFSPDSLRGGYSGLAFAVDGQAVKISFEKDNPDIGTLALNQPIAPSGRAVISTPFTLKIPGSWSRLGHIGQSYQMTQWFPKPAVFDASGWHAMPYLNAGEFYSEYGSFEVEITLPENYVVAATGLCTDRTEADFIKSKLEMTRNRIKNGFDKKDVKFPPSSPTEKTLHFSADRVHDFAWFADKRFNVVTDTAVLKSGKRVPTWAYFTNDNAQFWQKGAFYVKRSVEFYSEHVGEYAWPQCSSVHSALSAGGGMEYPMITVINSERSDRGLDDVTAHEIGHNWFAMMLGSNEREHTWQDEGLNTYYEDRYMRQYWGGLDLNGSLPRWLRGRNAEPLTKLSVLLTSRNGIEQAPETTADEFSSLNYGTASYMKPAIITRWLENSVGTERFDRAMQAYFREWKMRHPRPEDFREIWTRENVGPVDWYFEMLNTTKTVDYSIRKVRAAGKGHELTLRNRGQVAAPFTVSSFNKKGELIKTEAVEGFLGKQKMVLGSPEAHRYVIDNEQVALDLNRRDNARRTSGLLPGVNAFHLRLLNMIEDPTGPTLGILPWLGGNANDGAMAGAAIYSALVPGRKFEYFVAPGYGFETKRLVGIYDVRYTLHNRDKTLRRVTVGAMGKAFTEESRDYAGDDETLHSESYFQKAAPYVEFHFKKKLGSPVSQMVRYQYLGIRQELTAESVTSAEIDTSSSHWTGIHELGFFMNNRRGVNPFSFSAKLEQQDYKNVFDQKQSYTKAILEWKNTFSYAKNRGVHLRLWGTAFLQNSVGDRNRIGFTGPGGLARGTATLFDRGYSDYRYDELWLDRNGDGGFASSQISTAGGGFHTGIDGTQAGNLGVSNRWVASGTLVADSPVKLPGGLPLKPYFDFGVWKSPTFNGKTDIENTWDFGLMLDFKRASIHFPIASAKNLRVIEKQSVKDFRAYFGRITWQVRLGRPTLPGILESTSM